MTDQLGSPRILTNSLGEVVSRRDFMPFGEEISPDGTHRLTNLEYNFGDDIRQKFTGYQKDEETQLDFAEARMYQNLHGRFTAVDPLLASGKSANPQTFNRYVYVLNNPLILTDPDGLQVGTAHGKVYKKGGNYAIFRGKPYAEYSRVTKTSNITTDINGVSHYATVTPNGWTIGGRVDNRKFAVDSSQSTAPSESSQRLQALGISVTANVRFGTTGIAKGVVNAPVDAVNGLTSLIFHGFAGFAYLNHSNPFEIPRPLPYNNAREGSYGSGSSTGTLFGAGLGLGTIFGGSSAIASVVPESTGSTTLFRAVSQAELNDILVNGFRPNPNLQGYQTGKLFATSAEDAAQFGRNNFGLDGIPNFVVQTEASPTVMGSSVGFPADSMKAVSVPSENLNLLNNIKVCNFSRFCH